MRVSCSIWLTPFAPGLDGPAPAAAPLDPARPAWMVFWSAPIDAVMLAIAQRLALHPGRLSLRTGDGPPGGHDDVEICGPVPGHDAPQVLALVAYGLTANDAREGLDRACARLLDAQRRPLALTGAR